MSLSPLMVKLGGSEDWYGWNIMYINGKLYSLQCWMLQVPILWKKGSGQSCLELNFPQKVSMRTCLSPLRVELGGSEDWYGWNIMYKNGKLYSLQGWTLWKIPILWKKASSKSYLELNSQTCLSPPPWVGAVGLGTLIWLKYNAQKWQIIFTSGLNAAKNTDFMEKCFK